MRSGATRCWIVACPLHDQQAPFDHQCVLHLVRSPGLGRTAAIRNSGCVSKPGFLAHVDASGNRLQANELTLRTQQQLPKFLSIPEAVQFIGALSPRRTQLVAYLMLLCGLRREEACALDVRVLPTPAGHSPSKAIKMTLDPSLTPTKGSKERWVMVPYDLAGHLFDYMMRDRPKLAGMYHKRHGAETTRLFLTRDDGAIRLGGPSVRLHDAGSTETAGIHKRHGAETTRLFLTRDGAELSLDGLDVTFQRALGQVWGEVHASSSPTHLRHLRILRMSERRGMARCTGRDRLGHSSITTTEVYVHAADLLLRHEPVGITLQDISATRHLLLAILG